MIIICLRNGSTDCFCVCVSSSLNHLAREHMQDKIAEENLGLARRLQAIRPAYEVDKFVSLATCIQH